jgi:hypothetical protein
MKSIFNFIYSFLVFSVTTQLLQPLQQDTRRQYISTGDAQDNDSKEGLRVYMNTQLTNPGWDKKHKEMLH